MYVCERFLEQIQHILCTPVTMIYSINSSKIIGEFHGILNFNWLFLKLNCFICNHLPVLLDHRILSSIYMLRHKSNVEPPKTNNDRKTNTMYHMHTFGST